MATHAGTHAIRIRRFVRQLHRWLGLLIAIQVLLWISGGLVMSALRLEEVRGEDRAQKREAPILPATIPFLGLSQILSAHGGETTGIVVTTVLGRPVYRLESPKGARIVDAVTGVPVAPLQAEDAKAIAVADYKGDARVEAVEWVDTPALEYRGRDLPLWRVGFDDDRHTTIYVSPGSGQVVARRNDLWRVFDFVWMLHIMDYEEREDFNNPLLIATAATTLLFVLTGIAMLGYSFAARRSTSRRPGARGIDP